MSFGFGASVPAAGSASAELGPELSDVFTDEVGFKGVSGDANIRFLPTPWPDNALPSPTSSLLAVAQTKGVVVGAGPDTLVVASTNALRESIVAPTGADKIKTKPFQPQATIPLPARPTHVAFTSGDDALVLATENGSQISVFQTTSLMQGNGQPAFSIQTNGVSLRAVAPNPDPNSTFVGLVTANGELLMADLKAGNLVSGPNGPVLKTGVSSVSWSNKGKQLVAGLADGTGYQMTPDGTKKDEIPRPSDLEGECHISSIAWLENDIFFVVYTPNSLEDDMGQNPPSSYYIITRRKQAPFLIQKLPEICSTLGFAMKRTPAYQFIVRLRDYKPHLKDALIISSTASADVGLITRSDQPLAHDDAAKKAVGQFTTTDFNDDTKRASIPLRDSSDDTSVIGFSADLSSTESVIEPIAGEEIQESSTPLPNLLLLNNDGILSSWWFIYNESIRQKIPYSGQAPANPAQSQPQQPAPTPAPAQQPSFGQPSFGNPSPFGGSTFGKPSGGATFGSPSGMGASTMGATAFGKPSAAASFGSPSQLGGGAAPAFGKPSAPGPSFGAPSQPGPAFGAPSTPGQTAPQFGRSGFGTMGSSSTFGQPSTPGKSLLGTGGAASGGGFSSFSTGGGFGGFAAAKPGDSPFAKTGESAFAKGSESPFGASTQNNTAFAAPSKPTEVKNPFGPTPGGFTLGSTFKGDGTAANDGPKPDKPSGGAFSFGGSFDEMISSPSKASPPAESMDDMEDAGESPLAQPAKTETPSIFGAASKPASQTTPSIFGAQTQSNKTTTEVEIGKSSFSMFGNNVTPNQVTSPLSEPSDKTATPMKEQLPATPPFSALEAPLPPDPTSRASYAPGDTSASSNVSKSSVEDAPLPPDFIGRKKSEPKVEDDAPLPPDFISKKKPTSPREDAPLPPDFLTKPKKAETEAVPEDAPLPPDPVASKARSKSPEKAIPIPDGSDADSEQEPDESEFSDSGEEIENEESPTEETDSKALSAQSSFGAPSVKSATSGLFSGVSKPAQDEKEQQKPRQLFGEIPKQPLLPPPGPVAHVGREPERSPSPTRVSSQKSVLFSKPETRKDIGSALSARKASLTQLAGRDRQLRKPSDIAREEQDRANAAARQREEEEELVLSDDDEDERLRADLARPAEPVSTLDPFLPHQNYMGETAKPGIAGQIERLYRDINSMVDTLGINARSMESYLLFQQPAQTTDAAKLVDILQGDQPADVLDQKLFLNDIASLDEVVVALARSLSEQRVQGVEDKLEQCRDLLAKEIVVLRGQCASIRKTLDAHTDTGAILAAPLSAEQATLQHDLRTAFTGIQAQMADLEQGVSLLRAKIADIPRPEGADGDSKKMKRPTVEAVTSTIATMMSMAENKSSDIDVLEAQMRKLGVDIASVPGSREESPFTTPRKNAGRFPTTPGSRGSLDGSAYHTPESASRGANFRASINGSAKASRLRSVEGAMVPVLAEEESARWKAKNQRRHQLVEHLKKAIDSKKTKVRGVDDL
ncbi:Nuclear pore complex protein [Penicillium lagena]|uniref:Nuclear pore complex protein n=1 Tax=Penicillium lagena TaxID=94218 RepID=UPI00254050D2|nr:Nuclear pore complex protein [Penicillium lagena]KAJ5612996.1 Nuclear pore complex protein [Penicillium lagena]